MNKIAIITKEIRALELPQWTLQIVLRYTINKFHTRSIFDYYKFNSSQIPKIKELLSILSNLKRIQMKRILFNLFKNKIIYLFRRNISLSQDFITEKYIEYIFDVMLEMYYHPLSYKTIKSKFSKTITEQIYTDYHDKGFTENSVIYGLPRQPLAHLKFKLEKLSFIADIIFVKISDTYKTSKITPMSYTKPYYCPLFEDIEEFFNGLIDTTLDLNEIDIEIIPDKIVPIQYDNFMNTLKKYPEISRYFENILGTLNNCVIFRNDEKAIFGKRRYTTLTLMKKALRNSLFAGKRELDLTNSCAQSLLMGSKFNETINVSNDPFSEEFEELTIVRGPHEIKETFKLHEDSNFRNKLTKILNGFNGKRATLILDNGGTVFGIKSRMNKDMKNSITFSEDKFHKIKNGKKVSAPLTSYCTSNALEILNKYKNESKRMHKIIMNNLKGTDIDNFIYHEFEKRGKKVTIPRYIACYTTFNEEQFRIKAMQTNDVLFQVHDAVICNTNYLVPGFTYSTKII